VRAVILIGGGGERLRPLTDKTRKAFLPLGSKRVIDHIMDRLPKGLKVEISEDDSGAISAVSHCLKDNQPLMVIAGDNYFSQNLDSFISAYAGYTLVGVYDIKSRKKAQNFGVVHLHRDGRQISRLIEKPSQPLTTLVSTGLYIFPPQVFTHIRNLVANKPKGNLGEIIQYIMAFEPVYAYSIEGEWFDIGTKASYQAALNSIGEYHAVMGNIATT